MSKNRIEIHRVHDGIICNDLTSLRAGDECMLSGPIYTVRDATCKRLVEELRDIGELPYNLEGQMLFYAGPTPPRAGRPIGSVGPTSSYRMDGATAELMDAGVIASLGKASRTDVITDACKRNGGVYFGAIGGIAALLAKHIIDAEVVAYEELGTEALIRLELDEFPVFVALDTQGTDWYVEAPKQFLAN